MSSQTAELDAWLRDGGLVITASDRAARAIAAAFHRARQGEGVSAWPAPSVMDWNGFVRSAWEERSLDGHLLLNPAQEQAIWEEIVGESRQMATLLEGPRHRLAGMAMEAHGLLCSFAPRLLQNIAAHSAWEQDAKVFSGWLAEFDKICRSGKLLSASRLPLELIPLLASESTERPPLILAGFDRLQPVQRSLFDAWGERRQSSQSEAARDIRFHSADDARTELAACAEWCASWLATDPHAQILVVTREAGTRRGEIERAFLGHTGSNDRMAFEFSLGVPLGKVALARGAFLLLRWFSNPIEEYELDWLFSAGQAAASAQESSVLQAFMRALRCRGLARPQWTLEAFLNQSRTAEGPPATWSDRMRQARRLLTEQQRKPQSHLDWAAFVPRLLQAVGWPGSLSVSSAEFQALRRWEQVLDGLASLGFDGRAVSWSDFMAALSRNLEETLFVPESRNAPIQITGAVESAGLTADAIWFLGATEDAWPARGAAHPLLPPDVQRDAGMPHATPQIDWELASAVTSRLLASAPEVNFSFARQNEGTEARPSRLIVRLAGPAQELPKAPPAGDEQTVPFADASLVLFPLGKTAGGAGVLTNQSQCPFKAFATARLGAQGWEPAEAGLTAAQRGQLLHAVLHSIWAGPPDGIRSHAELQSIEDRGAFVARHVARALQTEIDVGLRERLPRRYLELEVQRLTSLVTYWLEYESARWPFDVVDTEVERVTAVAGLSLKLRLDRLDRLSDGAMLVVDYKTGNVSPKAWDLPRPDDVQLPLYAGFALDRETEPLGGLVFAKVRTGNLEFVGRVGNAKATLLPNLGPGSNLVRIPFEIDQLILWREYIDQLARDFIAGRAEVNPREYPKTCERCGLQTLCRIQEHRALLDVADDSKTEEAADADE